MATASKSRSRMVTPPPQVNAKAAGPKMYSREEKQQLLDNFDCEDRLAPQSGSIDADDVVQDKIRSFEAYLSMTVQSLIMHQNSEMFRIPADLRKLTIREIQEKWGGSLGGTVMRMKREKIEAEERERMRLEEEERRLAAKRKAEEEELSPGRSKNARRDGLGKSTSTKRKPTIKKGKSAPTRGSSAQPSNHIFNPLLPPTPKMPRAPRRGESLLSINGSPLAPEDSEASDNDDDLPDPAAYAAKLAKSQRGLGKSIAKPKGKRAPSLMIRQSLAPAHQRNVEEEEELDGTRSIALSGGRFISYNPYMVDPARMEEEMRESGLSDKDVEFASQIIRAEALKALMERMGSWKM